MTFDAFYSHNEKYPLGHSHEYALQMSNTKWYFHVLVTSTKMVRIFYEISLVCNHKYKNDDNNLFGTFVQYHD